MFAIGPPVPAATPSAEAALDAVGVRVMQTAFQAPNMHGFADRWVQSIQRECLDRLILFGERRLHTVLNDYLAHYKAERPHRGIGNELVSRRPPTSIGDVVVDERLGGLLKSYRRSVA